MSDSGDQPVCLCFHVSRRKLEAFLRVRRPSRASQLSECGGAGTGCGWCVPYLKRLFEAHAAGQIAALPEESDYAASRSTYRETGERPTAS